MGIAWPLYAVILLLTVKIVEIENRWKAYALIPLATDLWRVLKQKKNVVAMSSSFKSKYIAK